MDKDKPTSLKILLRKWKEMVDGTSFPQPPDYDGPDVEIVDIVEHTDYVKYGSCFVARQRVGSDGHPFVGQAAALGASAIIGQKEPADIGFDSGSVPYLMVDDSALVEAWLAAALHEFPSKELVVIGITGTDGKTTTANILLQLLRSAGFKTGLLSTIKAIIGDEEEALALHVTTPEAPIIQKYLRRMVNAGITYCVLEVTSHGLAQHRVAAIEFDVAVLTNVTHEHLDYHGDYEGYLAAKSRLFHGLSEASWDPEHSSMEKRQVERTAILNRDDHSFGKLAATIKAKQLAYSVGENAQIMAANATYSDDGTEFTLKIAGEVDQVQVRSAMVGEFNVYNMLAAAGAAHVLGLSPQEIAKGLGDVRQLSGRMEQIDGGQNFLVIVDFAHTPNGLEKAIRAARSMTTGRIICVFGSAGKRDVAKRTIMAEISAREADLSVLTAEDPRTDSLDEILATMAEGCRKNGKVEKRDYWRIRDRGEAIHFALGLAEPEDLVLICGKGHEQSMCFGIVEYPWDDRHATRAALASFLSGEPMIDLGLPTFGATP